MNDTDFLFSVLSSRNSWLELSEILDRSRRERGHAFTVHSRAADLRKRGHLVEQRSERGPNGRVLSYYRLVPVEAGQSNPPRVTTLTTDGERRDGGPASTSTTPQGAHAGEAATLSPASPAQLSLIPGRGAYDEEAA